MSDHLPIIIGARTRDPDGKRHTQAKSLRWRLERGGKHRMGRFDYTDKKIIIQQDCSTFRHGQPARKSDAKLRIMVGADGFITKDKFGQPLIQMIHGLFDAAAARLPDAQDG